MPEEVVVLIVLLSAMTFIFTLIRSSQKFKLKKMEQQLGGKSGDSLTTSELREMIEDAVAVATDPLRNDLESMTSRLDQIEDGGERILLEDEGGVKDKTVGRSVRQRQRQR